MRTVGSVTFFANGSTYASVFAVSRLYSAFLRFAARPILLAAGKTWQDHKTACTVLSSRTISDTSPHANRRLRVVNTHRRTSCELKWNIIPRESKTLLPEFCARSVADSCRVSKRASICWRVNAVRLWLTLPESQVSSLCTTLNYEDIGSTGKQRSVADAGQSHVPRSEVWAA